MHETDVREALRGYVSDLEPPMALGSAEVLGAARRSQRMRMAAAVASVALAGALVAGGVAVVPGWVSAGRDGAQNVAQSGDGFGPARPCASPPGPAPAGTVSENRPLSPEQAAWASAKLTCHLATALPRLLPDARYGKVPGVPAEPLVAFSRPNTALPFGSRVDALALVRDAKGTGDLTVFVGVSSPAAAVSAASGCRIESTCTVRTGPNGETIAVGRSQPDPVSGFLGINVHVYRGHTYVYVEVSNSDRQGPNGQLPTAKRDQPVLSADQAVELALSPELYLFP